MKLFKKITSKLLVSAFVVIGAIGLSSTNASASTHGTTRMFIKGDEQNIQVKELDRSRSSSMQVIKNADPYVNWSESYLKLVGKPVSHNVLQVKYYLDGKYDANGGYAGAKITAPTSGSFGYCGEKLAFRYSNTNYNGKLYLKICGSVKETTVQLPVTMFGSWGYMKLDTYAITGTRSISDLNIYIIGEDGKQQSGEIMLADFAFTNDSNYGKTYISALPESNSMGYVSGANCYVEPGAMVVFRAIPNSGYKFVGWSIDKPASSKSDIVLKNSVNMMNHVIGNVNYIANFEKE